MQTPSALDLEIAMLRERLEAAEDMRVAIADGQVDGFVVGRPEPERLVLLESALSPQAPHELHRFATVTVSRVGQVLHANQRFAALVGRPIRELFSSPLVDLVYEEDRAALAAFLSSAVPDSSIELRLPDAAGQPIGARLVAADVGHGYLSLLLIASVLEERLDDAEHALAAISRGEIDGIVVGGERIVLVSEADQAYRHLIDRMEQGAVSITRGGDVIYANEALAAMLGLSREALRTGNFLDLVQDGAQSLREVLDGREPSGPFDVTLTGADGAAIPVAVAVERSADVAAITLVLTNLTERHLHRRIREETQRKDEFLAVLGHELRNPLASIRTAVEILDRSSQLGDDDRYAVQIVRRQTDTLVRLVDDLLDIHRLNQGKIAIRRQPVLLREIVRTAIEAVRPILATKELALSTSFPADPVYVDGDQVRLTQVLLNVLGNAAKFTPREGTIRIDVSTEPRTSGERVAHVVVSDNGCGIEPEMLDRIFEPYTQGRAGSDASTGGLGLGLSVSRRLMELHGGRIRAHSDGRGAGSRFEVTIPLSDAPALAAGAPAAAASASRKGARVLVVDDNRDAAESLAMLIRASRHEVRTAYDGREAVAVADEFRPDVVFLDIGMPTLDGYATAKLLRAREWCRDTKLFALTGYGRDDDRQRAREAGFDEHFVKPVDIDALTRALAQVATP